jgi:hypothetical protein
MPKAKRCKSKAAVGSSARRVTTRAANQTTTQDASRDIIVQLEVPISCEELLASENWPGN